MRLVQETLDLLRSKLADLMPAERWDDVLANVELVSMCGARPVPLPDNIGKPLLQEGAQRHAIGRKSQAILHVIERGHQFRRDFLARLSVQHLPLSQFNTD